MSGKNVRKVELQLLRHGPPHNQLLSPLTDYLALCGDHPNTTLNFPLEHESLRVRLRALRYEDSEETRRAQLDETARIAADVLAAVPGLISDLGRYDNGKDACVHLSIATSAAELASFPFELANSPPGFPGSGGSLCLQAQLPVCLTRRSRNVRRDGVKWNLRPTILLIASDAGGTIPLEAHHALLRNLVDPWIPRRPTEDNLTHSDDHARIVLLRDASARSIENAINGRRGRDRFTHVHVLAHGCKLPGTKERFGIALHPSKGSGIDVVEGAQLGRLLSTRLSSEIVTRPNVVTLAVCDSSNQGDVSVPGASIAFELHEADIPLVVGSQFPLTFRGSIVMTEALYSRLLMGCDPRVALWETRKALFAQSTTKLNEPMRQGRHDWASMVAFAAFPFDIANAANKLAQEQMQARMDTKLEEGDRLLDLLLAHQLQRDNKKPEQPDSSRDGSLDDHIPDRMENIESEVRQFNRWLKFQSESDHSWLNTEAGAVRSGVGASANKRLAELLFLYESYTRGYPIIDEKKNQEIRGFVRHSHRIYSKIAEHDRNKDWALVQKLFLHVFLELGEEKESKSELLKEWQQAKCICELSGMRSWDNSRERTWHLTNQIELGLILHIIAGQDETVPKPEQEGFGEEQLHLWCDELDYLSTEAETIDDVYSGRRQITRYPTFANMLRRVFSPLFQKVYDPLWERINERMSADGETRRVSR